MGDILDLWGEGGVNFGLTNQLPAELVKSVNVPGQLPVNLPVKLANYWSDWKYRVQRLKPFCLKDYMPHIYFQVGYAQWVRTLNCLLVPRHHQFLSYSYILLGTIEKCYL